MNQEIKVIAISKNAFQNMGAPQNCYQKYEILTDEHKQEWFKKIFADDHRFLWYIFLSF